MMFNEIIKTLTEEIEQKPDLSGYRYQLQRIRMDKIISQLYYHGDGLTIDPKKLPPELTSTTNALLMRWSAVAQKVIDAYNITRQSKGLELITMPNVQIVWPTYEGTSEELKDGAFGWVEFDDASAIHINAAAVGLRGLDQLKDIIPHEMAHIVAYLIYGNYDAKGRARPYHGVEWRNICKKMGFQPATYARHYADIPAELK